MKRKSTWKICPCGSGKKFKKCCKKKNIEFVNADEDSYTLRIPLNDEMISVFNECDNIFFRHFERKPDGNDPIVLARYLVSERDMTRDTIEAMIKAGIEPAKIYAYKKTGYLISEQNLDKCTGKALQEWNEAIEEYDMFGGDPDYTDEYQKFDELLYSLSEDIESIIYAMGMANDNYFNVLEGSNSDEKSIMSITQYQALCICRAHKTLRSILTLTERQFSEDILKLARTIYESYLHIIVVQHDHKAIYTLVDSVIGMRNGTYEYKKNENGKENKRVRVNLITGDECPDQISAYKMAESSPYVEDIDFFDYFYKMSSQFIHPSILSINSYISNNGFDPVKPHMDEEAIIFTTCVSAMILDWIPKMKDCPDEVARDCITVVSRIRDKLLQLISMVDVWIKRMGTLTSELDIIHKRCLALSSKIKN